MTIETIEGPSGFIAATEGMRAPMSSWEKSDSNYDEMNEFHIGEKDKELSVKLQTSGPEHSKHLRQIVVWTKITAPREWFIQMATYRIGVECNSTSTMHTLMRRPLVKEDFEFDCVNNDYINFILTGINTSMEDWKEEKDPEAKAEIWRSIIEVLPQSYLQTRYMMFSYAALRNIVHQREGHKLKEWAQFIEWVRSLPNSWMIFD